MSIWAGIQFARGLCSKPLETRKPRNLECLKCPENLERLEALEHLEHLEPNNRNGI